VTPSAPGALLLDTCTLIWFANGERLSADAVASIQHAARSVGVFVSTVSAWEVGLLCRRPEHAAAFVPDARTWFARVLAAPGIRTAACSADIAIDASSLPGDLHRDPGDRLLVATARQMGVPLMTRDRRILEYAAQGHVQAVAC
jgi:PIN domain nuclease of toxin-antitoxin system